MSQEQQLSEDEILSMDFPDDESVQLPQVQDAPPEPQAPQPEQPQLDPAAQQQPQVEQPQQPELPSQDPRVGHAFQRQREELDRKVQELEARHEAERYQWQMMYQQAMLQQQQQQEPAGPPDRWENPDAYDQWRDQQLLAHLQPQIAQMQQQYHDMMVQHSIETTRLAIEMQRGEAKAAGLPVPPSYDELYNAASNYLSALNPVAQKVAIAEIQGASNKGLAIAELGRYAMTRQAPQGQAQPVDREAVRQEVLREEAARRAQSGAVPQAQAPRGVGPGASGTGFADGQLPQLSQVDRMSRRDFNHYSDSILGSF